MGMVMASSQQRLHQWCDWPDVGQHGSDGTYVACMLMADSGSASCSRFAQVHFVGLLHNQMKQPSYSTASTHLSVCTCKANSTFCW